MNLDFAINFYNECVRKCKKDEYNILLNKHLGDLVYIIQAGLLLQSQKGKNVHFILNPKHEFLMKMFNITNYSLFNMDEFKKEVIKRIQLDKDEMDEDIQYWCTVLYESNCYISLFATIPVTDVPFVPDSLLVDFNQFPYFWARRWFGNMGLDEFSNVSEPYQYPTLSEIKLKSLERIAPLNKIVLFAPEALTANAINPRFWEILVKEIQNKGYTVFVNSKDKKYLFKDTYSVYDYNLSLEDVIALGMQCAYVFSLRSGLNDVLIGKHSKMYCFYPASLARECESLNKVFKLPNNHKVNEILISNYKVPQIMFENEDISIKLNKFLLEQKNNRIKTKLLKSVFIDTNKKKIYKSQIRQIKDLYGKIRKHNNEELIKI